MPDPDRTLSVSACSVVQYRVPIFRACLLDSGAGSAILTATLAPR
jgi:hypothetical protein